MCPAPPPASSLGPVRRLSRLTAALLCAGLVLTGCGNTAEDDGNSGDGEGDPLPEPDYDSDDSVQLPVGLITPAGHALNTPLEDGHMEILDDSENVQMIETARSEEFGCEDTVSVITTVPVVTDDVTAASLGFLLSDAQDVHGEPEFINELTGFEDLQFESASVEDDVVTVELSGEAVPADVCQAERIYAQVEATARAASGASEAQLLLEDEPLAEALGIEEPDPLRLSQISSRD